MVPSFLEISLDQLANDQGKLRQQMAKSFGSNPAGLMEDQVRQNVAMFNDALKMFTPFVPATGAAEPSQPEPGKPAVKPKAKPSSTVPENDELSVLKNQIDAMQAQLNTSSIHYPTTKRTEIPPVQFGCPAVNLFKGVWIFSWPLIAPEVIRGAGDRGNTPEMRQRPRTPKALHLRPSRHVRPRFQD